MKNFEALKNTREILTKVQAEIPKIESALVTALGRQAELDELAIRSAALEAKDVKQREAAALENKQAVPRLRAELESAQAKIKVIEEEVKKLGGPALADLRQKYHESFSKAVAEFVKAAEVAEKLESKIQAVRKSIEDEALQANLASFTFLPPLHILIAKTPGDPNLSKIERYKSDCRDQGIEID